MPKVEWFLNAPLMETLSRSNVIPAQANAGVLLMAVRFAEHVLHPQTLLSTAPTFLSASWTLMSREIPVYLAHTFHNATAMALFRPNSVVQAQGNVGV